MTRGAAQALSILLLCAACFGGSTSPDADPASFEQPKLSNDEVAAFSERIKAFYGALEDVPLHALVTYENKKLRDCFESPGAFSDYFSALATEARDQAFRDVTARSVRILEFRFEEVDRASVDVAFRSVHQRALRFWSIGFDWRDEWVRGEDGVWRILPPKL